tara:strand:+ start:112 stop:813 length:702 start_codon:yes stop_codon:yes gene_type:complete
MSNLVLTYICTNKKQAIIDELVHYIQTNKYHIPSINKLMYKLIEEIYPEQPELLTPHFKQMLISRPKSISVGFSYSCRMGLDIVFTFTYPKKKFMDIEYSRSDDTDLVIDLWLHKKRQERQLITVLTPPEWKKNTPLSGIFTFEDKIKMINRKIVRTPNTETNIFKSILFAYLPKKLISIIDEIQLSNTWDNMKTCTGKLLMTTVKEKHIPIKIKTSLISSQEEQTICFSHTI